jgi:two-component system OmpR family sensor kinase
MSLRARLVAGFALVLVAFIAVGATVVVTQRNQLIDQLDRQLGAVAPLNRGGPQPPAGIEPPPPPDDDLQPDAPISDLYIAAVGADGTIEVIVQGQLLESGPLIDIDTVNDTVNRHFDITGSAEDSTDFRVLIEPAGAQTGVVVIALPMTDVDDSIRQLIITFVLLTVFVGGVLALLAWWILRLGLRPISDMTSAAAAIAAGDREHRAPQLDERTEAGQLAMAFNEMLDQRDGAEDRLRQFVSDASHELRTPLTSISGYLDLYQQGGFREEGQLDDVVRRMQSESHRMADLVENLLALARLDEQQPLQRSIVDVGSLVTDVVADSRAAYPDRRIDAEIDDAGTPAALDRHKIEQLLAGLVSNALTHAPDASVVVRSRRTASEVVFVVVDDGPGLSDEQTEHVFERFYRGDSARARPSGGSGLGLAIANSIAIAHGGSIHLKTSVGEGCEFTVRIPDETDPDRAVDVDVNR